MITLTEAAVKQLESSTDDDDYVRIGVKGGGCSGFQYFMEVEETCKDTDVVHEHGSVKICIDKQSDFMLSETTVDYTTSLTSSGFQFNNKRACNTCGCGSSFSCG